MYNTLYIAITNGRYDEALALFTAMLIITMSFLYVANSLIIQIFKQVDNRIMAVLFTIMILIIFFFILIVPDLYIELIKEVNYA